MRGLLLDLLASGESDAAARRSARFVALLRTGETMAR
jgi:hypothetical protein